jgi:hypothetical protein
MRPETTPFASPFLIRPISDMATVVSGARRRDSANSPDKYPLGAWTAGVGVIGGREVYRVE